MAMEETVKPTRMELMTTKNKMKLAVQGHRLLKQKRDVLVLEFFQILEKARDLRGELDQKAARAYQDLAVAEAYHGVLEVENAAMAVSRASNVEISVKNIMGVKVPDIKGGYSSRAAFERGYGITGTSAKIDEAAGSFEETLATVIALAKTENALIKLLREIEKTKRRVNALEYVVMPRLRRQSKYISMRLDEMERETFFTLKTIKKKLARKQQSPA
ncbi:MAG: V-type ATP synthase subunit D [Candidatus ainarchaeum sp.]|nr:V-type ATP synthase subunit D [Candidatus ainarchaeum sp.]